MQPCFAGRFVPADIVIAWCAAPWRGSEADRTDSSRGALDEIAPLSTGKGGVAEVVVACNEVSPALLLGFGICYGELDWTEIVERFRIGKG